MTDAQAREAARQFFYRWKGKGKEDEDARSYWIEILQDIFGMERATERLEFEKKVAGDRSMKRIDVYIPETHVVIEQKSLGIPLDRPQPGHDNKTPYEQAKEYDNLLPYAEKARWIITSNFGEIWIYDMAVMQPEPVKLTLADLQTKYHLLDFLVNKKQNKLTEEVELSKAAGELVGKIRDRFLTQYNDPLAPRTQKSLNVLCVRLVFCFYAEDAGLFGEKDAFSKYILRYRPGDIRGKLLEMFRVLDTPLDARADLYLDDDLAAFPFVNGGLFSDENIVVPKITQDLKETLAEAARFDWSKISPTIFGAVFESTLNPVTRRSGGMHYTSLDNIHKLIDPLFLDDLKEELREIRNITVLATLKKRLNAFQDKLASLIFLDPACGSGNFLTETYLSLRRLENEALRIKAQTDKKLMGGQITFGFEQDSLIKVSIHQFYGIEINDFAVSVAQTALWIAESQMMQETEDIIHAPMDFFPLKTYKGITEGNALKIDWKKVCPADRLDYIIGNPPFIGASMMTKEQKNDAVAIFGEHKKLSNSIDYVGAWYYKAAQLMQGKNISAAFVSTNSITQGEQVSPLWDELFQKYNLTILFGYRTFIWDSEANQKAHVHCVIIGFCCYPSNKKRYIYDGENIIEADNISPYLVDAPNVTIVSHGRPLCDVPKLTKGNQPTDNGNFILNEEQRSELIKADPSITDLVHRYIGGKDFLNNNEVRYCLWLKDVSPNRYSHNKEIMRRLENIRDFRSKSTAAPTRKSANWPYKFFSTPQTNEPYLIIPRVSSERRRYIPMGYMTPDNIASDSCSIIPGGTMYHFGVLSSNVHMAWMRTVAGRLKSDYRYSGSIVYNNFPWPSPTETQKNQIEKTAQGILDARSLYPDSSLADLYDPLTMPQELRKAHQLNDKAVMQAYGMPIKETDEASCVAWLMRMYQQMA